MANANFNKLLGFLSLLSLGTLAIALPAPTHTNLAECLAQAGVEGVTTVSSSWGSTIEPFNLRLPYIPAAVALPTTPQEVAAALRCAKTYGVKVQPRGGGHSYGAQGLGGKNGSLVIDMNRFNAIEFNPATNVVKVGSGVRLGNLLTELYEHGRALPHGVCPGVGIGGHATHGGFGFTSRMWGITLDKITKLDVVLANGTITTATATVNPDLFWALRGAGSSFGVVTKFHLNTVEAPSNGIQFQANIPSSETATVAQQVALFLKMQDYGMIAVKEIALRLFVSSGAFAISGVYWGNKAGYDAAIAPFAAMLPNGTTFTTIEGDYPATIRGISYSETLVVPLTGYDEHDTFFAKSIVTSENYPQTEEMLTPFFNFIFTEGATSGVPFWMVADLYGGQHSKINEAPLGSSSYAHRDSFFTWQLYSSSGQPPYPANYITFMNSMVNAMTQNMDPAKVKGYANYNDPTLTAAQAHQLYYGNDKWDGTPGPGEGRMDKLVRIKKQVDPGMLLWNPQAIGV